MAADFVLALDQGTTSSRAIVFDRDGGVVAVAQREYPQGYPFPGHVTHDPEDIWDSQLGVAREVLEAVPGGVAAIAAVGITNQRETTIVWDRATGEPVAPAIVWQSRITAEPCAALREAGHEDRVRCAHGPAARRLLQRPQDRPHPRCRPRVCASAPRPASWPSAPSTASSSGASPVAGSTSPTSPTPAARCSSTSAKRRWDPWLCELMGVPLAMLPEVRPSSALLAESDPGVLGASLPISGIGGDQMAATFGQACLTPGMAKNTYGTGAFALLNTGTAPVASDHGLLSTMLWQLGEEGETVYALEGSVFVAGAAVHWLRDGLKAIAASEDVERLASAGDRDAGVVVVPAFVGLGAPHWDPDARGAILGLTFGTGLEDIALATVDAMAYQVTDVLGSMALDTGGEIGALRVDGGAAVNDALLQFQADILRVPVERPKVTETTALGAAFLAGLASGFWSSTDEVAATWQLDRRFEPQMEEAQRDRALERWHRAVERSKGWAAG